LRSQPFAHVVLQKLSSQVCDWCLKSSTDLGSGQAKVSLQRCSSCKVTRYCGAKCQRSAWPLHKEECAYLKKVAPRVPTDTVRLLIRIIFKLKAGGSRQVVTLPDGSQRAFADLLGHTKEVVHDEGRTEAFNAYFEVIRDCLKDDLVLSKSDIFEIYCKVLINSFNVMSNDNQRAIGIGLYLAPSVLDHSCRPNAVVVFSGKVAVVRCIEAVANFRDVRIAYTDLVSPRAKRRTELSNQYYFQCQCPECQLLSEESKWRESCKTGSVVCTGCSQLSCPVETEISGNPDQEANCDQCGQNLTDQVTKRTKIIKELKDLDAEVHPKKTDNCKRTEALLRADFFSRMRAVFSPCDAAFSRVLEELYEHHIAQEQWKDAYAVGCLTVECHRQLYPKYDVLTCHRLMMLGKLALFLELDDAAESHLTEAKHLVRVTYGPNHPVYSEMLTPLLETVKFAQLQKSNNSRESRPPLGLPAPSKPNPICMEP